MIVLAAVGGSWMCGWICWIGGIQDLMEPLAHSRIRINPRWGQGITLTLLVVWVPLFWWLFPDAISAVYTPFGINFDGWPRHAFQFDLMLLAGLSVFFLGKRGICRYLCPFNSVVGVARRWLPKHKHLQRIHSIDGIPNSVNAVPAETAGCSNCAAGCHSQAIASAAVQFTPDLTIPLAINHVKREVLQEVKQQGK